MKWVVTRVAHSTSHRSSSSVAESLHGRFETTLQEEKRLSLGGPSSPRLAFRGDPSASGQRSSLRFCATWRPRGRHPQEGACRALVAHRFLPSARSTDPFFSQSGFGSWAFRRLTLVPSIIFVPGEEELPARCPR